MYSGPACPPTFLDHRLTAMCQAQVTFEKHGGRRQGALKGAHGRFREKYKCPGDYRGWGEGRWMDSGRTWGLGNESVRAPDQARRHWQGRLGGCLKISLS